MGLSRTPPRDRTNSASAPTTKRKNLDSSTEKDKSIVKERKLARSASLKDISVFKLPGKQDEGKNSKTSAHDKKSEGKQSKDAVKVANTPTTPRNNPVSKKSNAKSAAHCEKHCAKCEVLFDDDDCLSCSCCQRWFHSQCLDLTAAEIEAFTVLGEKAHFYCESCEIGAQELYLTAVAMKKRIDSVDQNIVKIQTEQSTMKTEIYTLQNTQDKNCDDIDSLYEDVGQLQSSCAEYKTDIQNIDNATKKVKADHLTTSTIVTNLRTEVNKNNETLAKVEQNVKNNDDAIKNLKSTLLSSLREELKTEVINQIKNQNIVSFPALPNPEGEMETDQSQSTVNRNQQIFREMINDQCAEREDIMKRKYQLMIANLKEANSPDEDMNQTTDLLKLLKLDEEIIIKELVRMGKTKTDKPRLIRITLEDLSIKRKILAKATTLRNVPSDSKFAKVYIKPNLTALQLKESKNLQEELRARRLQDPSLKIKIYRGKIVPVSENH